MSKSFFDLTGGEYWTAPWKNLKKIAWDAMVKGTPEFCIDGPEFVPLDERKTLPLLAFQSGTTADLAKTRLEELAVVTLVNLGENRLLAQRLPRPTAPPAPAAPASPGFACLEFKLELTELFNLPWERSSYVATVVIRDQATNRVLMQLGSSPTGYADPEVERFLEAQRAKKPPRLLNPPAGAAIVRHGRHEGSVPPPGEAGIEMRVERVLVARPDASAWLEVGFRLPVSKTDVLPPPQTPSAEKDAHPVSALAVVSLLIFGSVSNLPRVFQLVVPSFEKVEGGADAPVARGEFAVDIAKLANLAKEPQTFFVYAFSGEVMAGPAVVAFVDERLLPPQS